MFRISRANLIGACFGFLLYATISSMINHLSSTQHMQVSEVFVLLEQSNTNASYFKSFFSCSLLLTFFPVPSCIYRLPLIGPPLWSFPQNRCTLRETKISHLPKSQSLRLPLYHSLPLSRIPPHAKVPSLRPLPRREHRRRRRCRCSPQL